MPASQGRGMLLKVGDGTSPPSYTTIGGIKTKSFVINNDPVDITDDDSAPWRKLLENTGLRYVSISGSGVHQADAQIERVEDDAWAGSHEDFQMLFPNGDYIQGLFHIQSYERSGDSTDATQFSISLESAGPCEFVRV